MYDRRVLGFPSDNRLPQLHMACRNFQFYHTKLAVDLTSKKTVNRQGFGAKIGYTFAKSLICPHHPECPFISNEILLFHSFVSLQRGQLSFQVLQRSIGPVIYLSL